MRAHPACSGVALARGGGQDSLVDLPALAGVVRAEEDSRSGAEPDTARLGVAARLDMPRHLQLELAVLGEAETFERVHVFPLSVERWTVAP